MNQIKTGQFIAECRKEKGLTQSALAEHFGISDRAVSKWENGKCMPDVAIMVELCQLLGISVNDLLSGERIPQDQFVKTADRNLMELKHREEKKNRRMLILEALMEIVNTTLFIFAVVIPMFTVWDLFWRTVMQVCGLVVFLLGMNICLLMEKEFGFYKCGKCEKKFEAKYHQVFFAMHIGRTRYMKCPDCKKYSWCKKTVEI